MYRVCTAQVVVVYITCSVVTLCMHFHVHTLLAYFPYSHTHIYTYNQYKAFFRMDSSSYSELSSITSFSCEKQTRWPEQGIIGCLVTSTTSYIFLFISFFILLLVLLLLLLLLSNCHFAPGFGHPLRSTLSGSWAPGAVGSYGHWGVTGVTLQALQEQGCAPLCRVALTTRLRRGKL